MKELTKQKQLPEQMNRQASDAKANASAFLFLLIALILKTFLIFQTTKALSYTLSKS